MTTTAELQAHVKALDEKIERNRKEDADQRHAQNKATVKAIDSLSSRMTELEQACREQEAACEETKKTTDRIFNLLQGDPELGHDGFLKRQTSAIEAIGDKVAALEADKTESKQHRTKSADIPERVTEIERSLRDDKIRKGTVIAVLAALGTIGGVVGGIVSFLIMIKWVNP